MSWQSVENKLFKSFDILLGISPAILSTEFRSRVRGILQEKYPDGFERSALRELVEGNLGSNPIVPSTAKKARVNYALILMDVLETLREEELGCPIDLRLSYNKEKAHV